MLRAFKCYERVYTMIQKNTCTRLSLRYAFKFAHNDVIYAAASQRDSDKKRRRRAELLDGGNR